MKREKKVRFFSDIFLLLLHLLDAKEEITFYPDSDMDQIKDLTFKKKIGWQIISQDLRELNPKLSLIVIDPIGSTKHKKKSLNEANGLRALQLSHLLLI